MRITGRELRRVINEEVRRSMKLNLREDANYDKEYGFSTSAMKGAAATASEGTRSQINDYLKACSGIAKKIDELANNESLSASLGAIQGHFMDITKKGSASVYSAAINDALLATALNKEDRHEQIIAVIGTLQSGKWTDLWGAYATIAGDPETVTDDIVAEVDTLFNIGTFNMKDAFLSGIMIATKTDIITLVTTAKEEAATSGASVAASREKTKSAAATPAASTTDDAAKWAKYEAQGNKFVEVHATWNEFTKTAQAIEDGWTASFASFVDYYKYRLAGSGVKNISPEEMIRMLNANIP